MQIDLREGIHYDPFPYSLDVGVALIMKTIQNSDASIGENYPVGTGRHKIVSGSRDKVIKVALAGDSTFDNGYWVQQDRHYADKTATVTHKTAVALAKEDTEQGFEIANFAVDGATTRDLRRACRLDKVLPRNPDHPHRSVHQLNAIKDWTPDVVVLSVAGNNYREALQGTLRKQLTTSQLLFRITPTSSKAQIKIAFDRVKKTLLREYKAIIDSLIEENPQLERIVLMSQYYPALTFLTPYFIYTGFSHLARAEGKGQTPFEAVQETMNELYRDVLKHAMSKKKEVVLVDVTSSLNPLGGNHTAQIEPNARGADIMGRLLSSAVNYEFPTANEADNASRIVYLKMSADERSISSERIENESDIEHFSVKPIAAFIQENRYKHVSTFFACDTTLSKRYESAFHVVMGNQFDMEFNGLFAFGLLDASLVTVMAHYLWQVALNDTHHTATRVTAAIVSAPVLVSKLIVGLTLLITFGIPIAGYHKFAKAFSTEEDVLSPQEESIRDDVAVLTPA